MKLRLCMLFAMLLSFDGFSQKYLLEQDVNADTLIPKFGYNRKFYAVSYSGYGLTCGPSINIPPSSIYYSKSWQFREGIWGRMKLNKWYALGAYFEYARDAYRLTTPLITDTVDVLKTVWTKQVNNNLALGIFNRISLNSDKVFLDLGVYYAYDCLPRILSKTESKSNAFLYKKTSYTNPIFMERNHYGIDLRLTYKAIGVYGRYRISGLYKNQLYDLPKLMIGLVVDYEN